MGRRIYGCAMTQPRKEVKATSEPDSAVVGTSWPHYQISVFLSMSLHTTPDSDQSIAHAPSWILGKDPSTRKQKLRTCQCFIPSSAYVAGRTYGRNGAGRCKDPHRSSHDSPIILLDQGTCNYRSEKRGSSHGAIEEGECLGISSAGAEGAWIGSFFLFDNGG